MASSPSSSPVIDLSSPSRRLHVGVILVNSSVTILRSPVPPFPDSPSPPFDLVAIWSLIVQKKKTQTDGNPRRRACGHLLGHLQGLYPQSAAVPHVGQDARGSPRRRVPLGQ